MLPSRYCRDARVYDHTTTMIMSTPSLPPSLENAVHFVATGAGTSSTIVVVVVVVVVVVASDLVHVLTILPMLPNLPHLR